METGTKQELLAYPSHEGVQVIESRVRDSPIDSVVVYKDRAEVKRRLKVYLAAGENELVVSDIAECVDKNSVRVEGKGQAVITDVIYSSKESSNEEPITVGSKEEYQSLLDEITEVKREQRHLQIQKEVLEEEKKLLNKFAKHVSTVQTVKGEGNGLGQLVHGDNITVVMEFFERVEGKLGGLDSRLNECSSQQKTLDEKLKTLLANAENLNPNKKNINKETIRTLHVGLEAAVEGEAVLFLSYVVSNASWSSSYDLRVFTRDKSMKVQYYGLIKQVTCEDWENASISLSTAQPSIGGSAPKLPTKIVRFVRPKPKWAYHMAAGQERFRSISMATHASPINDYDPTIEDCYEEQESEVQYGDLQMNSISLLSAGPMMMKKSKKKARRSSISPPPSPKSLSVDVAKVSAGLFNTTYAIPRATTIPADNTEHKVTVALIDLSPELTYTAIPRLSPYSFLQAKAKNTSPYTILAGPANVFLDNNFVAKSEMSDVSPNEDFSTSLGADQSIRITVRPVSSVQNTRTGMLGGAKSTSITYTHGLLVKNTRSDLVSIQVSEQVPLSTDERIKVNVVEPGVKKVGERVPLPFGHAVLNEANNLEWEAKIEPSNELELKLVYIVEHPTQDGVTGLPK